MSCAHGASPLGGQCPACLLALAAGDEPELAPGTIVAGRFRIDAPLGRGGMGEVYRADDLKLGHAVALKFVPAGEETLREVRAGREIAHPNVCRIYDIVDVDDNAAIVMELIDGRDLASATLPHDKAIEVAREICAGLAAIHERGIAHGDLKPSNVMIDGRGRARITDLGLSHRADESSRFGGTPAYMAPEQFATRKATPQSDVYALGLLLRELLGDEPAIIARCLNRDPAARPSAAEVAAALAPDATPSPEYVAASEQAPRLSSRQAWALGALIVALLAAVIAFAPRPKASHANVLARQARVLAGPSLDEAWWFDSTLVFHYRSSPRPMLASRGRVTDTDPPFDVPGMRRVTLTANGAVLAVQSAPQLAASPPSPEIAYTIVLALTLAAGAVLAWRNLRAGRVDRAGAVRAALWVFACEAVAGVLVAHHPPSLDLEAAVLTAIAGAAALAGAEVWIAYAALEPYARRDCPQALVGWMRLLRRRMNDPLVLRDLLVGAAAGLAIRLINLPRDAGEYAEALSSARAALGAFAHSLGRGVFYALFALFLLVLLRVVLRAPALAAAAWLLATTAAFSHSIADAPLVAAEMLVVFLVLRRFGLLAASIAIAVDLAMLLVPL